MKIKTLNKPLPFSYPEANEMLQIPNRRCQHCSHLILGYMPNQILGGCAIPTNDEALMHDEPCPYFEQRKNQLSITITTQDLDLLRQIKEKFIVFEEKGFSVTIGAHQVIMVSASYEIYTNSQLIFRIPLELVDKIEVR